MKRFRFRDESLSSSIHPHADDININIYILHILPQHCSVHLPRCRNMLKARTRAHAYTRAKHTAGSTEAVSFVVFYSRERTTPYTLN